ncbi:MAG: hydrogenobyrinic acid a,c-diamide synthase (glutamine-hydrolyzing) [Gammaproteobacteria bacterium]|nr:hydrogenobyrinic acid a,c-diamide synthase (glutamine-hydrolyzing) [Gammaproteobacteria bacterium]
MKSYLISSTKKSSGKTIITSGLCSVLNSRDSLAVFKKGPDYIDSHWLSKSAKTKCYNLDFFTMSKSEIRDLYKCKSRDKAISIIEGNKGLFDGVSLNGEDSNAALAHLLKLNIILVLDCAGITRGIAPLLQGYQGFDKDLKYKGVILNNVASDRHEGKIINTINEFTKFKVIGSVHKNKQLNIIEKKLGLEPVFQNKNTNKVIKNISSIVKSSIDIKCLLNKPIKAKKNMITKINTRYSKYSNLRIGIALDSAFGFYYPDDIEKIKSYGVKIIYFDTLKDKSLPNVDALIIGGGFPERVAHYLNKNTQMIKSISSFINDGLPVYAECGGLMYLCKTIKTSMKKYKMTGIINADVEMCDNPIGRGYVELSVSNKHPWFHKGDTIKCHEFHYSNIILKNDSYSYGFKVKRGYGINGKHDGILYKNLVASYSHLRDTDQSKWIDNYLNFINSIKK